MDVGFGFKGAQAIGDTGEIINIRAAPSRAPFFLAILEYFLGPSPHRIIVIIDNDNRNAIILIDNSVSIIVIIDNGDK